MRDNSLAYNTYLQKLGLLTRGYSKRLLRSVQNDVWCNFHETRDRSISSCPTQPLVIKYNTVGIHSARVWRDILNKNSLFNNPRIITAYSVHDNLGKILSNNKSKKDPNQPSGCCIDVLRLCVCVRHATVYTVSKVFTSNCTRKTYFLRNLIACATNNLVYLIACNLCDFQYVGETGRMLNDRFNDYRAAIRLKNHYLLVYILINSSTLLVTVLLLVLNVTLTK
jgi:hypothetical protein